MTQSEHPVALRDHFRSRVGDAGDESIEIQCNGIHTYPLEWTAAWIGLVSNALESIAHQSQSIPWPRRRPDTRPGKRINEVPGCFHYNSGNNATNHPEVRTMPSCVACGAELEPPRTAHPTPSTSRACTASPARTTAATTSSKPRLPPTSSPRSDPAPD